MAIHLKGSKCRFRDSHLGSKNEKNPKNFPRICKILPQHIYITNRNSFLIPPFLKITKKFKKLNNVDFEIQCEGQNEKSNQFCMEKLP